MINAARGSTGDGGRKDALQDLNADRVSLAAAPLEQAYLPGVDLKGAFLVGANLQGAYLADANLQGALFVEANLQGSNLEGVNLQGAHYLPQEQLNAANGNDRTVLPEGLTRPAHWSKAEGRGPSATQPDAR